jgi:hypothetical protein
MPKDTFYFSHDYNARNDEKIKMLIRKHGMVGYGVFWAIVEDLYNNANALRTDYDGIAYDLRLHSDIVKSVVNDFDLFEINGDYFGSSSVQARLDQRNEKSLSARKSASYRWNKKEEDANALQTQSEGNATQNTEHTTHNIEHKTQSLDAYASLPSTELPDCPHKEILILYKKHLSHLSQPRVWEGSRQTSLGKDGGKLPNHQTIRQRVIKRLMVD